MVVEIIVGVLLWVLACFIAGGIHAWLEERKRQAEKQGDLLLKDDPGQKLPGGK